MNVRTCTLYCNFCIPQITLSLDSNGLESTKTQSVCSQQDTAVVKILSCSSWVWPLLYKAIGDFCFMKGCANWWMCWKLFSCGGVARYVAVKLSRPGLGLAVASESDLRLSALIVFTKLPYVTPKLSNLLADLNEWILLELWLLAWRVPSYENTPFCSWCSSQLVFGGSIADVSCFLPSCCSRNKCSHSFESYKQFLLQRSFLITKRCVSAEINLVLFIF